MQRVLSSVALLGLLIATAAAFAITERLKLVKSPIYGTQVSKRLSPVCSCARSKASISVILRHGDDVTVSIVDSRRDPVRILAVGRSLPPGRVVWRWDGTSDRGGREPDGVYRVQIHLARAHRTILLPNRIVLDTRPPLVVHAATSRAAFSPDGDGRADVERIHYEFDSPAHAVLYLNGRKVLGPTWTHKPKGAVNWRGRVDGATLPQGTYVLWLGGVDLAGNATPVAQRRPVIVRIRYIEPTRQRVVTRAGAIAGIGVVTDAATYRWALAGRSGVHSGPLFRFRAPSRPGRYTLTLSERGHSATATIVVGRAHR
ncbi:MAG TPA: hypothetical protein VJ986_00085 [Gaiellaceae bacterium]|nr:hypothetical protein [Gaiellaceae bacterium]